MVLIMKTAQREKLSNREFYFVLYMMMLLVLGWFMDVNGIFLSKYFTLAGIITVPTIGGLFGFFIMTLSKQQNN
ncbi:DUF3925 family protein [Bacillus sp. 491mf]|uniref:DUF3925 family protein n=1 Tax=Bacillus sp. 491mf TaxID=1761755 RepID=UPI0015A5BD29|nr:DUF3925 family protein [Bacillus sp. 491mf]